MDKLREQVYALEREIAVMVGPRVELFKADVGDKLANELLASTACLFAARCATIIHVWTGEELKSVKKRMMETFDVDVKVSVQAFLDSVKKGT